MATPPKYHTPHLFFVISDPSKNGGVYHIVNITTDYIRAGKDCVLNSGDHDWITKQSYVSFRDAREITLQLDLDSLIGGLVAMKTPLRTEVLEKIVGVAKKTRGYRNEFKRFL
jgi:hypothetical protein